MVKIRELRYGVLRCIAQGIDCLYEICKRLNEEESSVHYILGCFERNGIIISAGGGARGRKPYALTGLGEKVYDLARCVNERDLNFPAYTELVQTWGKTIVDMALEISVISGRERNEWVTEIGPDATPPEPKDAVTLRGLYRDSIYSAISRWSRRVRSMKLKCKNCGYEGPVPENITFPLLRAWASGWIKLLQWPCPDCNKPAELCIGSEL